MKMDLFCFCCVFRVLFRGKPPFFLTDKQQVNGENWKWTYPASVGVCHFRPELLQAGKYEQSEHNTNRIRIFIFTR